MTLKFTEYEGQLPESHVPWYSPKDAETLVAIRMRQLNPIQDMELHSITAQPEVSNG